MFTILEKKGKRGKEEGGLPMIDDVAVSLSSEFIVLSAAVEIPSDDVTLGSSFLLPFSVRVQIFTHYDRYNNIK